MAKSIVFDEIQLTVRIPNEQPEHQTEALTRTLVSAEFRARLRRAIRDVVRAFPELAVVRVSFSR
ncbi:MAG: hypothetical protein U0792_19605 [Gemmataceae bacterium]